MRGLFKSMKQCKRIYQVDLILHRKRDSGDGQFEYWNVKQIAKRQGFAHSRGIKMVFKSGKPGGESADFPGYYPAAEDGARIWPNYPQVGFFHTFMRGEKIEIDRYNPEPTPWVDPDGREREQYKTTTRVIEPDDTEVELSNRIENRDEVERKAKLHEFGMHPDMCLITNPQGTVLFKGYERIVYGDHGPYLEFLAHNVMDTQFGQPLAGHYYNRRYPLQNGERIKLYCQKKTVADRPNPPKQGRFSTANDRPEGYADYRPGRFYVDPLCWHLRFIFPCPRKKNSAFLKEIKDRKIWSESANSLADTPAQYQHQPHDDTGIWPANFPNPNAAPLHAHQWNNMW